MYTWLRRIAINTYLNSKRKKSFSLMGLLSDDSAEVHRASADPDPEQLADESITKQVVERALETLSPRERTAFILRHHQELNTSEVAAAMDVSNTNLSQGPELETNGLGTALFRSIYMGEYLWYSPVLFRIRMLHPIGNDCA